MFPNGLIIARFKGAPTQIRVKCIPVIPAFVIDMLYNVSQKAKQFLWNSHLAVCI